MTYISTLQNVNRRFRLFTQSSNYEKQLKSFLHLDSESLENVENDLGDPHIGLVGCKNPIMFFYLKKINSFLNLFHFGKRFNPFTQSNTNKCEASTKQKNTKNETSVECKSSTGIFYLLKISKKIEGKKFRGSTPKDSVTKEIDQFG